MRLREDTSRNRTTMGITWLVLLSLGFLFHCVTSQGTTDVTASSNVTINQPKPETARISTIATTLGTTTKPQTVQPLATATPTNAITPTTSMSETPTNQPATSTSKSTPSMNNSTSQTQAPSTTNSATQIHNGISSAPPMATHKADPTITTNSKNTDLAIVAQVPSTKSTLPNPTSTNAETSKDQKTPAVTLDNLTTQSSAETEPTINPVTTTTFKITTAVENTSNTLKTLTTKAQETTLNLGPRAILTTATSRPTTAKNGMTTTLAPTSTPSATTSTETTTIRSKAPSNMFHYSLNSKHEKEEDKVFVEVCKRLMANLQDGKCTLMWQHHNGKVQLESVSINGNVKTTLPNQYYEELTKKATDSKTLIAILASCGALLIMIVILAVCASHHRKPYNETQQHLTEELHTVENGYHDNPTLEVMEVQPEMQEKKVALNGEFNDSWIVPIDNLLKEDMPDEEDTHL